MSLLDRMKALLRKVRHNGSVRAVLHAIDEVPYPPSMIALFKSWSLLEDFEDACMSSDRDLSPDEEREQKALIVELRREMIKQVLLCAQEMAQDSAQDTARGEQLELPLIPSPSSSSESA